MSEESNSFINRAVRRVFPNKERGGQTPESVAREAFLLVNAASPEGQKPLAEYHHDFDFELHKPGTVIRLHQQSAKYGDAYSSY